MLEIHVMQLYKLTTPHPTPLKLQKLFMITQLYKLQLLASCQLHKLPFQLNKLDPGFPTTTLSKMPSVLTNNMEWQDLYLAMSAQISLSLMAMRQNRFGHANAADIKHSLIQKMS